MARLLDTKTSAHICDHDACAFSAGKKASLAQRSVAMALLSGSARAARAKASNVCKLSGKEQE